MENKFRLEQMVVFRHKGRKYDVVIKGVAYIVKSKTYEYTTELYLNGVAYKQYNVKESKLKPFGI